MLYSYDVFDTLITRTTATPKGIFSIVDHILSTEYPDIRRKLGQDFYTVRINAETTYIISEKSGDREDISLNDIYRRMSWMTALSDEELEFVKQLELQTELNNIVGISDNIEKIRRHIEDGDRVVLISDMYLPGREIRRLLMKCDPVFVDLPIYVSGECGYKKSTGMLYSYVRRQELVRWEDWVHTGDNVYSDVEVPRSLGMKAIHYVYEELLDCERDVLKNRARDAVLQLFIGASRNVRLLHGNSTAAKLGSSYGAAILFQYTNWVLELCDMLRIKRLYFVARDGYIPLKIAELIKEYYGTECEFKYIYSSRKSWRLAAILSDEYYDLDGYLQFEKDYEHLSLQKLAESLGLDMDTVRECLHLNKDFPAEKEYNCLAKTEDNPFSHLNENVDLKKMLIEKNAEKKRLLDGYLRQELDLQAEKIGFAEVHGSGVTQDYLGRYISTLSGTSISSFYYILDRRVPEGKHKFYSQQRVEFDLDQTVEALTRAFHGRTVGYKKTDSGYEPELLDDENVWLERHGYQYYTEAVIRTAGAFLSYMRLNRCHISEFDYSDYYNTYLLHEEKGEIFEYICDVPMSDTVYGRDGVLAFAPRYSEEEIGATKEWGYIRNMGHSNTFSLRRCTETERQQIEDNKEIYWQNRLKSARYIIDVSKLGKNVALFGAGKVGSSLYEYLSQQKDVNLVVWVDQKFCVKDGLKDTVSSLGSYDFDQVIIGVKNKKIAKDIVTDLMIAGIDEEKVYWEEYRSI